MASTGKNQASAVFVGLGLVVLVAWWASSARPDPSAPTVRLRGITLDARRMPDTASLDRLAALGVSHVALVPYAFSRGDSLRHNPQGRWNSESDAGIQALADSLRRRGISVIIKPQVWLGRGGFPGDLDFETADEWERWEAQYRQYALHHADLAEQIGSEWFVIGTELARSAIKRPQFWRALAQEVRERFSGKLTYAANWYGEVDSLIFWDDLDAIGVQAYFPLSDELSPDRSVLQRGWKKHEKSLSDLAHRWEKPVLFTEVGYRSMEDAAIEPWAWTPRPGDHTPDPDLQARLFSAFFDGPWKQPWSAGALIWKWYGEGTTQRQALDFTPQNKPAEEVIRNAYLGEVPDSQRPPDGPGPDQPNPDP